MADLFIEGAVGVCLDIALKTAMALVKKAQDFRPTLEHYRETCERLEPMLEEIKGLNNEMVCSKEEVERLENAVRATIELVNKYSESGACGWRYMFGRRTMLRRNLEVDLQLQIARVKVEITEILLDVNRVARFTSSHVVARSESLPMNGSQWQKGKLIGRGAFGRVYVATHRDTGALCAMKEVEIVPDCPESAECMKQLEQEIKLLSQLKHPNIVQYYGCEIVDDRFYIYLEYVHPGSIYNYVREHCGAITESVIQNFTRHILLGLAYLHSKKTIHRDIKGANLLVDSAGVVKLADFGVAKQLTGYEAILSMRGTIRWMAPELMQAVMQKDNNPDLAFAIDIWSLGCTIIEMFTGKAPWSGLEPVAVMYKVVSKKDTPPIPETLSPEGKDFLSCCFKRNPAERSTASALLEHRFLKKSQQPYVLSSTQLYNAKFSKGEAAERRGFPIPSSEIVPAY